MTDYHSDQANIYVLKKKKSRAWLPIFIIIAVVIVMPIYGTALRYQVSISIRLICDYLGNIFQYCGWFILGFMLLKATFGRRIDIKGITIGILLLYVGAFLTGGSVSFLGITIYEPVSSPGFH